MSKASRDEKEMIKIASFVNTYFKLNLDVKNMDVVLSKFIKKQFRDIPMFTGQKRVVVEVGDKVMKLVHSLEGLTDNTNDICTSAKLLRLKEKGIISADDLDLFATSEPFQDDPYIIVADRFTRLVDSDSFNLWFKEHKNDDEYRTLRKNEMISYFIMTNKKYNEQHLRIITIIAKYFVGSDIYAFKVPENYCLDDNNNLVLIDLGSILPKYKSVDNLCDECGRPKTLTLPPVKYNDIAGINDFMQMKTGLYGCNNPNCTKSATSISVLTITNNSTDSVVFSKYQQDAYDSVDYIRDVFENCSLYIPDEEIRGFSDYRELLLEDTDSDYSIDDIRSAYVNSLPVILATLHSEVSDELEELKEDCINESLDKGYNDLGSFETFKEDAYDVIDEDENDILDAYVALLYIKFSLDIADDETDINIFDVLESESKTEFSSFLNAIDSIESEEHSSLWTAIKPVCVSK